MYMVMMTTQTMGVEMNAVANRTSDKRHNVTLTDGERRLLIDLVEFHDYLGQLTTEDTLLTALCAGLVKTVSSDRATGRPYVRPTRKGRAHQKAQS